MPKVKSDKRELGSSAPYTKKSSSKVRIFVRADDEKEIRPLPIYEKGHTRTPAEHMNYRGQDTWGQALYQHSGYLSLFEYVPGDAHYVGQTRYQATYYALKEMRDKEYLHFLFIPNSVQQIDLDEKTVRKGATTGATPTLFSTEKCRPPSKVNEDGDAVAYASRYAKEYLFAGKWPEGTVAITVPKTESRKSIIMKAMSEGAPVEAILEHIKSGYINPKIEKPQNKPEEKPQSSVPNAAPRRKTPSQSSSASTNRHTLFQQTGRSGQQSSDSREMEKEKRSESPVSMNLTR